MNRDQFKGQWSQFKGELKKQWGKFTDDDLMQIESDYDKFSGSLQKRDEDQKEEIRRWVEQWSERQQESGKPATMPKAG